MRGEFVRCDIGRETAHLDPAAPPPDRGEARPPATARAAPPATAAAAIRCAAAPASAAARRAAAPALPSAAATAAAAAAGARAVRLRRVVRAAALLRSRSRRRAHVTILARRCASRAVGARELGDLAERRPPRHARAPHERPRAHVARRGEGVKGGGVDRALTRARRVRLEEAGRRGRRCRGRRSGSRAARRSGGPLSAGIFRARRICSARSAVRELRDIPSREPVRHARAPDERIRSEARRKDGRRGDGADALARGRRVEPRVRHTHRERHRVQRV
jgi:hypothetical protein